MNLKYENIIDMDRPISKAHMKMTLINRAAQFAPFAALTGYEEAIAETARYTNRKIDLSESELDRLDFKLNECLRNINTPIRLIYFEADKLKKGGKYLSVSGKIKNIDDYERTISLDSGPCIRIDNIYDIESKTMSSE